MTPRLRADRRAPSPLARVLWASLLLVAVAAGRRTRKRPKAKATAPKVTAPAAGGANAGAGAAAGVRALATDDITTVTASPSVAFLKIRIPGACPSCAPMQPFWDRVAQAHPGVGVWQGTCGTEAGSTLSCQQLAANGLGIFQARTNPAIYVWTGRKFAPYTGAFAHVPCRACTALQMLLAQQLNSCGACWWRCRLHHIPAARGVPLP